tara:strand:+ start:219 stop:782 length:564 start_codon:yes stop_codon:yes gene_type:complete
MKKLFLASCIILLASSLNAQSSNKPNYLELVCAPDTEWEGVGGETKKIWFPSLKDKFLIHMDLEEMKVVKLGYSKNEDEIRDVDIPVEKKNTNGNFEYLFIKSGSANENLNIINIIRVLSSGWLDGLFIQQYRLNREVTAFIISEMKSDTVSEFERAMKKYESKNLMSIMPFGGSSTPECKSVKKYK